MGRRRKTKTRQEESAPSKPLTEEVKQAMEGWAKEAAEVHGLILYELELAGHGRWLIKVFVDKPEGISAAECADVSRYLETIFDTDERVPEQYVLEVSSPGVERSIKTMYHVELAVGENVELVLREPIHGKNKVVGNLKSHSETILDVEIAEEVVAIEWENVVRAKVKFDFSEKSEKR